MYKYSHFQFCHSRGGHWQCIFHSIPRVPQGNQAPCLAVNPSDYLLSPLPCGYLLGSLSNYLHSNPCLGICFCGKPSKKTCIEGLLYAESILEVHSYASKWILKCCIIADNQFIGRHTKWVVRRTGLWSHAILGSSTFSTTCFPKLLESSHL